MKRALAAFAVASALCVGCEVNDNTEEAFAAATGSARVTSSAPAASSSAASPSKTASSSSSKKNSLAGTWHLKGVTESGSWYVIFADDGSWVIKDTPDASRNRVYGTYTTKGSEFVGPMTNPGVGTGRINGSWKGDSIVLYFTEYWHTPHKTVQYNGSRK